MSYKKHIQGLAGFWGKLFSKLAAAVGAIIGGPVGAYVGNVAGEAIGAWVGGRKFNFTVFNPLGFVGLNATKSESEVINDIENELTKWHDKTFAPWFKVYVTKIKTQGVDISSVEYIKKFNEVLANLEALRLYYKSIFEEGAKGLNAPYNYEDAINIENAKTKSGIIAEYISVFKTAYNKAIVSEYRTVPYFKHTKFDAHRYNIIYSESINWNGIKASSYIKLLHWKGVDADSDLDYKKQETNPVKPTKPKDKDKDLSFVARKPKESISKTEKTNNASLLIVGSVAAGLIAKSLLSTNNNSKSK